MSKSTFLFCFLLIYTTTALGQTRKQCELWGAQHQRYAEQRRTGGTPIQMDHWRDRQRQIEKKMRTARCMQRFRIGPNRV